MVRSRVRRLAVAAGLTIVVACSGGDSPTEPDNTGNGGGTGTRMTATIDGQAWSASTSAGLVSALQFAPATGGYLIFGNEVTSTGAPGSTMSFTVNNITGPGTYPLGVDAVSVIGGFAAITSSSGTAWTTPISGAAGSITITSLTTTHIAATFEFTATGSAGGATGSRVVTNGVLDAPFQGNVSLPTTLPDSVGSRMTAMLSGAAWNAAIVAAGTSLGYISLTGINSQQTLIITIPQPTATGTYPLGNTPGQILMAWDPNAVAPAGARCCWGVLGDVGSITFTSLTITRAKGTFGAILSPQPGTAARGQLVITNGTFDVGLFHKP
jgi:hypothetical protein